MISNIATGTNTTMNIGGKQVPYTPKIQAKAPITYHAYGFEFTPSIRYVSTRYGLADDTQAVSPYAVVDLNASYEFGNEARLKPMRICGITPTGVISGDFGERRQSHSTSYYVAAPRTIFAGITRISEPRSIKGAA